MKIAFSPYQLKAKSPFSDRMGALIRFEFDDGKVGYSDCHPWELMGNEPLQTQLNLLKSGRFTSLTERSYYFATLDAEARSEERNIFENLSIPSSHWLVTDKIPEGFDRIKVKHIAFDKILRKLPANVKVRLDFNEKKTEEQFLEFLETHKKNLHRIDFIEDPFPFDQNKWERIQKDFPVNLACDRHSQKADNKFIKVIKPATQKMVNENQCVITSYLDHPLGQLAAAYTAAIHENNVQTCGLLSHHVYHLNPFSEQLQINGTVLVPPKEGSGFGFDTLLENQPWIKL